MHKEADVHPVVALGPVNVDALLSGEGVRLSYTMVDVLDPWHAGRRSHVVRTAMGPTRGQQIRETTIRASESSDPIVRSLARLGAVDDAVWYGGRLDHVPSSDEPAYESRDCRCGCGKLVDDLVDDESAP